jgi:dihydroflavonol-4-reductase
MTIALTGATGFTGRVLVPLLGETYPEAAMRFLVLPGDPLREGFEALLRERGVRGTLVEGSVTSAADVDRLVNGSTHVVHLAGLISYWRRDRARLQAVNVDGVRNVVQACVRADVKRLVHVSSVGAIGFHPDGTPADEATPFNWPGSFLYMTTKKAGQDIVEEAARAGRLDAVIVNPASIMGPGDPVLATPHNQLYASVYRGTMAGCFAGGLAVVDVRDLAGIIAAALEKGVAGERYLAVGANLPYTEVIRAMGRYARRKVWPFVVPAPVLTAAGFLLECVSGLTGKRPLLTAAYGRLSGWATYYSNAKSIAAFGHAYRPFEKTVEDSCRWFEAAFLRQAAGGGS